MLVSEPMLKTMSAPLITLEDVSRREDILEPSSGEQITAVVEDQLVFALASPHTQVHMYI